MLEYFGVWQYVGLALAAWVLFDLLAGYAYLHRKVTRREEPALYWITMLIWSAIAAVTFFWADSIV